MVKVMVWGWFVDLSFLPDPLTRTPSTRYAGGTRYVRVYIYPAVRHATRARFTSLIYTFRGERKGWMCNGGGLTVAEIYATYHTTNCSYTNILIYVATYILIFVYHTWRVTVTHSRWQTPNNHVVIRVFNLVVLCANLPTIRVVFFPVCYVNRVFFYPMFFIGIVYK